IGELRSVRRPPHRGALSQLFAVDPAGRTVLDPRLDAAVARDLDGICAARVADPHVAIFVHRAMVASGRDREVDVATALGAGASSTPSTASTLLLRRGPGCLGHLLGRDVEPE